MSARQQRPRAVATVASSDLADDARLLKTVIRPSATWGPARACALTIDGATLRLAATNGEVGVWCHRPCESATGAVGPVIVSGAKLIPLALGLEGTPGPVTLTLSDEAVLEAPELHARLAPIAEDVDWWQLPCHDETRQELDGTALARALHRVARAASRDAARPILSGVCLDPVDGQLIAVATDGYRLLADVSADRAPCSAPLILPAEALRPLEHLRGALELSVDGTRLLVSDARIVLRIALLDGTYPEWRRVIPAPAVTVRARTEAVERALSLVSIMADSHRRVVITVSGQRCQIRGSSDPGAVTADVPIEGPECRWRAALNVDYLQDAVAAMESEVIELGIAPEKPILLRAADSAYPLAVIMPMRE